jgi:AcrR family transcriptional regulator
MNVVKLNKNSERGEKTRTRILDAAEARFAKHGYDAVSLRDIIKDARVNVAAIHYYFNSKSELFEAAFSRRMNPINEQRRILLTAYEKSLGNRTPDIAVVIQTFILPFVRMGAQSSQAMMVARFLSRAHAEPDPAIRKKVIEDLEANWQHVLRLARMALPNISKKTLYWRLFFIVSCQHSVMRADAWLKPRAEGIPNAYDPQEVLAQLTSFVLGGLCASEPEAALPAVDGFDLDALLGETHSARSVKADSQRNKSRR